MNDIERREDKYIQLLREGYIDKEEFMELMRSLNERPSREKKKITFNLPPIVKKVTPVGIAFLLIGAVILNILPSILAATPTVNYISPSNNAEFIDVVPGDGVNYTVNVTDSDGNLERVVLQDNASGSWVTFYDSSSLGGVSYHNHSGTNSHWKGSWQKYYWKVCAYDGAWTNLTYSFTTEYVFGEPQLVFGDFRPSQNDMDSSIIYKNNTDYYLLVGNTSVNAKRTNNKALDWCRKAKEDVASGGYPYNAFTYNNIPYVYYYDGYLRYAWYNSTAGAWQTGSTGVNQHIHHCDPAGCKWGEWWNTAYGADVKYYNGQYCLVAGYDNDLRFYTSDNPLHTFVNQYTLSAPSGHTYYYMPSLTLKEGKLIVTYKDSGSDLHWKTYDGVNWVDKGDIEIDIGTTSSMVKDPVNDQLVLVYENGTGILVYRTLTNITDGWSESHLIFSPVSGKDIRYPHVSYIDRRLIITFAYNLRGNYNIYSISAPDYTMTLSGLNETYNRIVFPDATPTATHVNSTVFAIKNINDRDILNITWHVSNIGDITAPNNVKVWTNMSGSWVGYLVGSDGNTSKIDISALKGSEWQPGETTYWKLEILDMGGVAETLHATDEDIYYWVDLGT